MINEPSRTSMIVFFAGCGGAIGGALFVLGVIVAGIVSPAGPLPEGVWDWLQAVFGGLVVGALFGAIFGFVPALVGGAIYAFLPPRSQRIAVAPFIGAVASACWVISFGSSFLLFQITLAGAASALVCAAIARKLGIDYWPREGGDAPQRPTQSDEAPTRS
jgi:hypothetical protein